MIDNCPQTLCLACHTWFAPWVAFALAWPARRGYSRLWICRRLAVTSGGWPAIEIERSASPLEICGSTVLQEVATLTHWNQGRQVFQEFLKVGHRLEAPTRTVSSRWHKVLKMGDLGCHPVAWVVRGVNVRDHWLWVPGASVNSRTLIFGFGIAAAEPSDQFLMMQVVVF